MIFFYWLKWSIIVVMNLNFENTEYEFNINRLGRLYVRKWCAQFLFLPLCEGRIIKRGCAWVTDPNQGSILNFGEGEAVKAARVRSLNGDGNACVRSPMIIGCCFPDGLMGRCGRIRNGTSTNKAGTSQMGRRDWLAGDRLTDPTTVCQAPNITWGEGKAILGK